MERSRVSSKSYPYPTNSGFSPIVSSYKAKHKRFIFKYLYISMIIAMILNLALNGYIFYQTDLSTKEGEKLDELFDLMGVVQKRLQIGKEKDIATSLKYKMENPEYNNFQQMCPPSGKLNYGRFIFGKVYFTDVAVIGNLQMICGFNNFILNYLEPMRHTITVKESGFYFIRLKVSPEPLSTATDSLNFKLSINKIVYYQCWTQISTYFPCDMQGFTWLQPGSKIYLYSEHSSKGLQLYFNEMNSHIEIFKINQR